MTCPRPGRHSQSVHRQFIQACPSLGAAASKQVDFGGGQVGVPTSLEGQESPAYSDPHFLSPSRGSFGIQYTGFRGPVLDLQKSSGNSSQSGFSGFLWPPFCGPESVGGVEAGVRPLHSEHISRAEAFPHGDSQFHQRRHPPRGLGDLDRSQRRLFSSAHTRVRQEVPAFCLERPGFSVSGGPVWPGPGSLAFYEDYQGSLCGSEASRYSPTRVSRRLAPSCSVSVSLPGSLSDCSRSLHEIGFCVERGEIGLDSLADFSVSGHAVRHSQLDYFPFTSAHSAPPRNSASHFVIAGSPGSSSCVASRDDGIYVASAPARSASQASVSALFPQRVGIVGEKLVPSDSSGRPVCVGGCSVAGQILAQPRCPNCPTAASRNFIHGCVSGGLGCPHGGSYGIGSVAPLSRSSSHKSAGTRGSLDGFETVCQSSRGETCAVKHRQHYSGCVCEQTGRRPLLYSVQEDRVHATVVSRAQHSSFSKICSREAECTCGCVKQSASDSSNRVDVGSSSFGAGVEFLVQTSNRPICHQVQPKASPVCVPSSGSSSVGGGRPLGSVVEPSGLCVSTVSNIGESNQESEVGRSEAHSGGSEMGISTLVSGSGGSSACGSHSSKSRSQRISSAKDRHTPRKSSSSGSSCVVSVRQSLRSRGASEDVIELVELAHRSGTKKIYKSRWEAWCRYCKKKKISPTSPRQMQLAVYLASLKHLSASAVKGHRAAISTTLKQLGQRSFSESPLLKDVMKGASNREARSPKYFPAWDIFPVLASLRRSPFEPIESCDLSSLSYKTAFLIALASGRRCSEVHALRYSSFAKEPEGSISLRFVPEFLAKNQPAGLPSPPIFIKPLTPLLCSDDEDRTLCPVRALLVYIKRTKHLRTPAKRRLFVSFREGITKDITSATISRWIKNLIKSAFSQSTGSAEPRNCKSHEVRAWAASLAWANNSSLKAIMEAAYWFNETTFLNFYLRDFSHEKEDGARGISLVAAQQVIVQSKNKGPGAKGVKSSRK